MRSPELIHPEDTRTALRDALRKHFNLSNFDIVNNPIFEEIENDVLDTLHPDGPRKGWDRVPGIRYLRLMYRRSKRMDQYRKAMCESPWEDMK